MLFDTYVIISVVVVAVVAAVVVVFVCFLFFVFIPLCYIVLHLFFCSVVLFRFACCFFALFVEFDAITKLW
jgi:hypothetical protein